MADSQQQTPDQRRVESLTERLDQAVRQGDANAVSWLREQLIQAQADVDLARERCVLAGSFNATSPPSSKATRGPRRH